MSAIERPFEVKLIGGWFILKGLLLVSAAVAVGIGVPIAGHLEKGVERTGRSITADELQQAGVKSIQDALSRFAWIEIPTASADGWEDSQTTAAQMSRTSFVVYVNGADADTIAWQHIPLRDVKRIEIVQQRRVVRGPQRIEGPMGGYIETSPIIMPLTTEINIVTSEMGGSILGTPSIAQRMTTVQRSIVFEVLFLLVLVWLAFSLRKFAWYLLVTVQGLLIAGAALHMFLLKNVGAEMQGAAGAVMFVGLIIDVLVFTALWVVKGVYSK